jgi:hypothetical protein
MNRTPSDGLPPKPPQGPKKAAGGTGPRAADLRIAGVIGAELSESIHTMRRIVQAFHDTHRVSRAEMAELVIALEEASSIAHRSQQLARLSEGRLRQSHERVSLDLMVEAALNDRVDRFKQRGIEVRRAIKPVEIVVDPGLLSDLVDTAMDWALQRNQRIFVSLGINHWPEHGLLTIRTSQTVSTQGPAYYTPDVESLKWVLLSEISKAMGVTLSKVVEGPDVSLSLEFARTVRHLEGMTSMEIDASAGDSAFHVGTKALAGLRILLISKDAAVRGEVENACRSMGLRPDTVTDSEKAVRYTEREQPHMIIVDERVRDRVFNDLMQDIRRLEPNFGFLEVTDDANTFEVSGWMGDSMTRVSRNVLRQHLPSVLMLELAKTF